MSTPIRTVSAPTTPSPIIRWTTLAIIAALGLILASPCATQANELEQQRDSLVQIKQQISKTAGQLRKKKAAEKTALQQLEQLEQAISRNTSTLKTAANDIKQSRREIKQLKEKTSHYSLILGRSQKDVEKRLRALYTSGGMTSLRLFFSTETPLELGENINFLGRIAAHDKKLLGSYRQRMQQFHQAETTLEAQLAKQKEILKQQKEKKHQLEKTKTRRNNLISSIRHDATALNGLLAELEDRSARIMALVKQLEQKKAVSYHPEGRNFMAAKGQIPWPSSGAIRSDFGTSKDSKFGGRHKNNGLVIAAVPGTEIKAIWPGRIAFSAPFKGYGNLIIIDHGYKYYSLYAQVAYLDLPVGTIVKQGEVISTSGFEGRDSYYLEIRHGGTPMNPRHWLKQRSW